MRNSWLIFVVSALFVGVNSVWIGEEYWSIINYDGSIYGGRSINDFIRFKGREDRFVAYWITQGARVATVVRDECYDLIHDTNGDGVVDNKEHHNCRYGKNVCPISVYDFNKDGLLDEDEINECLKHLRARPALRNRRQPSVVVNNNGDTQFEAYGEAYLRGDRICAKFVDKDDKATEICGGFRVLSRGSHDGENPFEWYPIREISRHSAVEYLNHQIAQLWNGDRLESVFGGAHMDRQLAYAAFVNNTVLHVGRSSDPHFYDTNIDLLALRDGYFPKQYIHTGPERARRYGTVFTPDDLYSNLRRPAAVVDECLNLKHDTNGDGFVDSREHHNCRYGKNVCPISVYDFNKDGLLDEDEINECLRHLKSGGPYDLRNPRAPTAAGDECLNLRHDRNGDGYINSDELRSCRYGVPRCNNLALYDLNKDGFIDWNELDECQKRLPSDRFARFAAPYNYKNECAHPRHDRNGDGKIDRRELHLCRYGLIGCSLQMYDSDKDGFLNANEIDECQKHLTTQHRALPNHADCHSLKFDKNGDGIIDKHEYHSCKYGHCSLEIYDLDKDGILNAHEIDECQKRLLIPEPSLHHCHDLRNDKNGDGIIDRHEYFACKHSGCSLEVYDSDRDGYLSDHERSECYRHRKSDKYVQYCSDLYFDLNKNGAVDSYELERCLNRHDPSRHGHCSLEIYDADKNGELDSDEIDECQKGSFIPEPHHSSSSSQFNECHNLSNDKNGDGIVDRAELHACRYRLIGCNLEIYDLDKDGYLNGHETSECYKHLKTDRFVRYCQDLYFDLNKDGAVDTYELEKCLEQHDPIRRRFVRSHGHDESEAEEVEEVSEQREEVQTEEVQEEENSVQSKKEAEEEIAEKQDEILDEKKQEIQELNEEAKEEAENKKQKSEENDESDE